MGGISKSIGNIFSSALSAVGLGEDKAPKIEMPQQTAQAIDAPVAKPELDDDAATESNRKKTQRGGKSSLAVPKTGGRGLNV
ncbi:MAG: hypothetical protein [Caudoviricetes sp.]|nr:MAG: hypothetical protein [Caudoviricetes sp.]